VSNNPTDVTFGPLPNHDMAAAEELLAAELGGRQQARLGQMHDVLALPGVAAWEGPRLIGVATYAIDGGRAELAAIAVVPDRRSTGVGGRLVEAAATAVALRGVAELWLVTTNDNLDALRLYQRHGFRLAELHAGAVEQARRRKPAIPPIGDHGIPLRDELVLVRNVSDDQRASPYIAVVGPAAIDRERYSLAVEVGGLIAQRGGVVVCGGLGGVMEAAARGASEHDGTSVGILPGADRRQANPYLTLAVATGLGEARNALVVHAADAVIVVGGSWGTLSELAFAMRTGIPVVTLHGWRVVDADGAEVAGWTHAASAAEAVSAAMDAVRYSGR
jgi:uncharacterized protein (TIGR00725 family)